MRHGNIRSIVLQSKLLLKFQIYILNSELSVEILRLDIYVTTLVWYMKPKFSFHPLTKDYSKCTIPLMPVSYSGLGWTLVKNGVYEKLPSTYIVVA